MVFGKPPQREAMKQQQPRALTEVTKLRSLEAASSRPQQQLKLAKIFSVLASVVYDVRLGSNKTKNIHPMKIYIFLWLKLLWFKSTLERKVGIIMILEKDKEKFL